MFLFPALLIIGTLYLGYREVRSYLHHRAEGRPARWLIFRLIRRTVGLLIMMAIGVMIIVGIMKNPAKTPPIGYMRFWLICFMLVLSVLVLALWDAVCEVRKIKEYVDEFRNTEIKTLRKKFKIYHN